MKGCLRSVVIFLVLMVTINLFMGFLVDLLNSKVITTNDPDCKEYVEELNADEIKHQRFWGFREQSKSYCTAYHSSQSTERSQKELRLNMKIDYRDEKLWGSIYGGLVNQTGTKLDYLADSLFRAAKEHEFSRLDLARLVVSFVQDIPYSYVIPSDCETYETEGKPCIGNIPFGITSPYEFTYNLHGDCDTRAVLLYVLLEKLAFSPMIVVSDEYAHAMLALDLPAQGDYIKHAGRKYYFWETTGTGWPIGMLPPDANNIDYWEIALVHES